MVCGEPWAGLGVFPGDNPWSSQSVPTVGESQGTRTLKDRFPKQGVLRGPSGTGPQSSCPQSGGPKSQVAQVPVPQLASLSPWSPKPPPQSRDPISHLPHARELLRGWAAQDTPRPHGQRGQKGAVTSRATPASRGVSLVCHQPPRGVSPVPLEVPGLEAPGSGAMVTSQLDVPCQGSGLWPAPFPRTQTTQRSLGAVPRHYSHAGTGEP